MPIHDWTRVDAGLFHHFHQRWIAALRDELNAGRLRDGFFALVEPPGARLVSLAEADLHAAKANHIAVRHPLGAVVAVVEIVSPGNKAGQAALRDFVARAVGLLKRGVHLLVIDLFPPSTRDLQGIHKAIWDEVADEPFTLPADSPHTLASYSAGLPLTARFGMP